VKIILKWAEYRPMNQIFSPVNRSHLNCVPFLSLLRFPLFHVTEFSIYGDKKISHLYFPLLSSGRWKKESLFILVKKNPQSSLKKIKMFLLYLLKIIGDV
jgi:hypothetical protein